MGLLSKVLFAPLTAPSAATLWLARKLTEAAEAERNDPATLRRALSEAEAALLDGTLSEEDYDAIETDILLRIRGLGS